MNVENLKSINQINSLLDDYENTIESFNPFETPYTLILSSHKLAEEIIKIYLNKESFPKNINIKKFLRDENFPKRGYKIFSDMLMYKNISIHESLSKNIINSFLKSFYTFLIWFSEFYAKENNIKEPFKIEKITQILNSLLNHNFKENEIINQIFLVNYSPYKYDDKFVFSKNNETQKINEINNLLKIFENQLKILKNRDNFFDILIFGQNISESMIKLYLEKEGFQINKHFNKILGDCVSNNILPKESIDFLITINKYRNEGIHTHKPTFELIISFLFSFKYFLMWFDKFYSKKYSLINTFDINNSIFLIDSIYRTYDEITSESNVEKLMACPMCSSKDLFFDYVRGEVVCAKCGLVIEKIDDLNAEFREYPHKQGYKNTNEDDSIAYAISDKGLSTKIDWRNKDIYGRDMIPRKKAETYRLRKWERKIKISGVNEPKFAFALSELDRDSSKLGLPRTVREAAFDVYRSALEKEIIDHKNIGNAIAASLYISCRNCKVQRTLDEIAEVTKTNKKDVGLYVRFLIKELNIKLYPVSPVDYVPRFASKLHLSDEISLRSIEIINKAIQNGLNADKNPKSIAAAAIYISSVFLGERKTQKEVAEVAGVTEVRVNDRYHDICLYLEMGVTLNETDKKTIDQQTEEKENKFSKINYKNDFKSDISDYANDVVEKKDTANIRLSRRKVSRHVEIVTGNDIEISNDSISNDSNNLANDEEIIGLLKHLSNQVKGLENEIKKLKETGNRIEEKVDTIISEIKTLYKSIEPIQDYTSFLIKNSVSEIQIEECIENFSKQYINKIKIYSDEIAKNDNYTTEKIKLEDSFGEDAWNKLDDKSKTFLITAKVMYNDLIRINDITDYSGICILVTKALEEEMFKRFFIEFTYYLDKKYHEDYSQYHTALLYKGKTKLFKNRFTMGSIAYILDFKESKYDTPDQIKNNEEKLMEYCKVHIFSNKGEEEIKKLLNEYACYVEKIRKDYRNPSAHRNAIKKINAKECFELVLDVEKLLKRMLESFDS